MCVFVCVCVCVCVCVHDRVQCMHVTRPITFIIFSDSLLFEEVAAEIYRPQSHKVL